MRLAIVAVLAVGAVGLTVGGLTITEANHEPTSNGLISVLELCDNNADPPETIWTIANLTPINTKITTEFHINGQTETKTYTLESGNGESGIIPECQEEPRIRITDMEFLNATNENALMLYDLMLLNFEEILHLKTLSNPTAFWGTVLEYTYHESGGALGKPKADVEIIVVNVGNHTDVKRTTTDESGRYFVFVNPGGYLIQAIGGTGNTSYKYVTIESGLERINLRY